MHYVYLLKINHAEKQYYIGSTSNLKKRLSNHLKGKVQTTKGKRPVKPIYYECYSGKDLAIDREKKLKNSGSAYMGLMKRLKLK